MKLEMVYLTTLMLKYHNIKISCYQKKYSKFEVKKMNYLLPTASSTRPSAHSKPPTPDYRSAMN